MAGPKKAARKVHADEAGATGQKNAQGFAIRL